MRTIEFRNGKIYLIDQSLLPWKYRVVECKTVNDIALAIKNMKIRGAPAIGVAGAMGLALVAVKSRKKSREGVLRDIERAARVLEGTRPTAVDLSHAIERVLRACRNSENVRKTAVEEAIKIAKEDVERNKRIGEHGEKLIPNGATVLTHCNAGALATAGYGTALGIIRTCVKKGKKVRVIATETRPLLQGARLTAWELRREGISVKVIVDSAAGYLIKLGEVDVILVGADRIAANGDTANKIGTYTLSVLAKMHDVPFYVAAPSSTFDFKIKHGSEIPIEERDPDEVAKIGDIRILPKNVSVWNPAFDVTPAENITAFITEFGVYRPKELAKLRRQIYGSFP